MMVEIKQPETEKTVETTFIVAVADDGVIDLSFAFEDGVVEGPYGITPETARLLALAIYPELESKLRRLAAQWENTDPDGSEWGAGRSSGYAGAADELLKELGL